ncbi:NADH-ubiquinone oxidoreductase-F iron-sulfur binding region domain-containing protein [Kitasatospora aburaviensis]
MSTYPPPVLWFGRPVLFAGLESLYRVDYRSHLQVHGQLPSMGAEELAELAENVDLRGRGGAGFPFARKIRAVVKSAARRRTTPVVVVNGTEGEPSCLKDTTLILRAPHLVVDGALIAATAIGAERVAIGVTRADTEESLRQALAERRSVKPPVEVVRLPERFVTGRARWPAASPTGSPCPGEAACAPATAVSGSPHPAVQRRDVRPARRGGPLGCTALPGERSPRRARHGAAHHRRLHRGGDPTGVPLETVLAACELDIGQGVLVGGYHGKWLTPDAARQAVISRQSFQRLGGALGAGAILPLPETTCPLWEVVRISRWMADETAGQCGPCYIGLPDLTSALEDLVRGGGQRALDRVQAGMQAVTGRGACSHPDAAARFVASSLAVFDDDLVAHSYQGGCGRPSQDVLPLPEVESAGSIVVDWTLCEAHGLCTGVLPDVIRLGPDGFPAAAVMPVPARLLSQAARAVDRCPALALRMQ